MSYAGNDPDGPLKDLDLGPFEPIELGPIEPIDLGPIEPIDLGPIEPIDLGPIEPIDLGPIEPIDLGPFDAPDLSVDLDAVKDLSCPEWNLRSGDGATLTGLTSSPKDDSPRPVPVQNTGDHRPEDVANWIRDQLEERVSLSISQTAGKILRKFGTEFVWTTAGGNLSVARNVVLALHKICAVEREADEGEGHWRLK